uniref:Uncharacterized protein n=1 Tax=Lepeophtheirus salmonis TaxID=72036 RepID=A0A0K2TMH2_LEPSM
MMVTGPGAKNHQMLSAQNFWHLADICEGVPSWVYTQLSSGIESWQNGEPQHIVVGLLADFLPKLKKNGPHDPQDHCLSQMFCAEHPLDLLC